MCVCWWAGSDSCRLIFTGDAGAHRVMWAVWDVSRVFELWRPALWLVCAAQHVSALSTWHSLCCRLEHDNNRELVMDSSVCLRSVTPSPPPLLLSVYKDNVKENAFYLEWNNQAQCFWCDDAWLNCRVILMIPVMFTSPMQCMTLQSFTDEPDQISWHFDRRLYKNRIF